MKIGVVDTMFARADMGALAVKTIKKEAPNAEIVHYTVPGVKDLAIGCKKLFDESGCDIIIALGMAGKMPIDETCAHEANLGLIHCELMVGRHIMKIFVHEKEAKNDKKLVAIMKNRVVKHSTNAVKLLNDPSWLRARAGTGQRQGAVNAKILKLE